MKKTLMAVTAAIVTAMCAASLALAFVAHSQAVTAQHQVASLKSSEASLSKEVSGEQSAISQLQTSVAGITVPTDPLSAYSDICNSDMTNQSTGINQTYYYPCTNNVETIPQSGS
jgi:uncharacterized protein YlxW (UPF0749 family)